MSDPEQVLGGIEDTLAKGMWLVQIDTGDASFDHIDYGATALRKDVIAAVPAGTPYGLDAIQRDLAARHRLRALIARERFFEIGSPDGLDELDRHLRRAR